jgi:hypothetical protein
MTADELRALSEKVDTRPSWFRCASAEAAAPFTPGVIYEVHSYDDDGRALIMTDGPKMKYLPFPGCTFEPHDPYASYLTVADPAAPAPTSGLICPTCGKASPDGLDCLVCARWWAENCPRCACAPDVGLVGEVKAMIEAFHADQQQGQGEQGDGGVAGRALCQWVYDNSDRICTALSASGTGFQDRVGAWMLDCFDPTISNDRLERRDRFIEEALELAQTLPEFTANRAHALVDYVFSRPVGFVEQEVGGVSVTLAALCHAEGIDQGYWANAELERIEQPEVRDKIRAKQASKPVGSALPIPPQEAGK